MHSLLLDKSVKRRGRYTVKVTAWSLLLLTMPMEKLWGSLNLWTLGWCWGWGHAPCTRFWSRWLWEKLQTTLSETLCSFFFFAFKSCWNTRGSWNKPAMKRRSSCSSSKLFFCPVETCNNIFSRILHREKAKKLLVLKPQAHPVQQKHLWNAGWTLLTLSCVCFWCSSPNYALERGRLGTLGLWSVERQHRQETKTSSRA